MTAPIYYQDIPAEELMKIASLDKYKIFEAYGVHRTDINAEPIRRKQLPDLPDKALKKNSVLLKIDHADYWAEIESYKVGLEYA